MQRHGFDSWSEKTPPAVNQPSRVHHNYWACALEAGRRNCWGHVRATATEACGPRACASKQEKPLHQGALALQERVAPTCRN